MDLEDEVVIGKNAKDALQNPIIEMAFKKMESHLNRKLLSCNPDNKDQTQRVVIAMQILTGIQREIIALIQNGEAAEIQLKEIEPKKAAEFKR